MKTNLRGLTDRFIIISEERLGRQEAVVTLFFLPPLAFFFLAAASLAAVAAALDPPANVAVNIGAQAILKVTDHTHKQPADRAVIAIILGISTC